MHTHHDPENRPVWAPFMVVYPGETWPQAAARHRRDTGHSGPVFIAAINRGDRMSAAIPA